MRRSLIFRALVALVTTALLATSASAQSLDYQGELAKDLEQLEQKLVGLAQAIDAEKYSWAPAEGVRTVSQSLMHTAAANFFFPSQLGVALPEGINPRELESITDKAECIKVLEQSFDALQQAIAGAADMTADQSYFGTSGTVGGFLHGALSHNHEHLGQMIAYARSIGVTPPWSQ